MEGTGPVDAVVNLLIGLGLPGVIIIALGFAVHRLYNRNQELLDTMVETGRETVKAQEAATASINRLSDLLLRGSSLKICTAQIDGIRQWRAEPPAPK